MARWEPDAVERLHRAAVELFIERGYDAVSVSDIAGRAGLTRRSSHRYFSDKREVLFAGSERLPGEIERLMDAAEAEEPLQSVVVRVLTEVAVFLLDDHAAQQRRHMIIATSSELRERERSKIADIAAAIAHAMTRRGVAPLDAELLGEICAVAFRSAYDRTILEGGAEDFAEFLAAGIRTVESFVTPTSTRKAG